MNKAGVFAGLVVLLLVSAYFLPVAAWIQALFEWIQGNPGIAWAVFLTVYIAATVLLVPGSLLTLGAGALFGLTQGYVLVAIASVTGATCAFLLGRFFARDWVEGKLAAMPRFAALDRAVSERGALIVLLTRLSPLFPFNLLNYALGLTNVRVGTFVLVSWVGMIPGTLLYVYLGSVATDLASIMAGDVGESPLGGWLFYGGLVATLVLTIVITRFATRALNEQLEAPQT